MAFIYADQVPAQQAVQYAQLKAQEEAQRQQALRDIAQQGISQQNAAAQRAMAQAQMKQQMEESERSRQARAAETSQVLASQEKVAGMNLQGRNDFRAGNEKFDSVAALIESEDPPTDSEFEALTAGLAPDRKLPLKTALAQKRRMLGALVGEAQQLSDFWNAKFDAIHVGEDKKFADLKSEFMKDRRANELLQKDPKWTGFRTLPKYKGPRMDAQAISPNSPNWDALIDRTTAPQSGVTPIGELLKQRGFAVPDSMPSRGSMLQRPMALPRGVIMDEPPAPMIDHYIQDDSPAPMIDPYAQPAFAVPMPRY